MSYATGEAAILTQIREVAGFDDTNSGRQNWKILNSGLSDHYAILRPGAYTIEPAGMGGLGAVSTVYYYNWNTEVLLYQRYKDDHDTLSDLLTREAAVLTRLLQYRYMAATATVHWSIPRTIGAPEIVQQGQRGPLYLRRIINVEWREQVTVTFAE